MKNPLAAISSTLASTLRLWGGTWGNRPAKTPLKLLELFDREDDPECRLVREALTELNLDVRIYPCPPGGKRFAARRNKLAPGVTRLPVLYDPNSAGATSGAGAVLAYLSERYSGKPAVLPRHVPGRRLLSSQLASLVRNPVEISARPSRLPKKPLVLYSFESSPFSRLVRERLCALELPYLLINMGKLQWSEMGPASFRLALGPYRPLPGTKRDKFLKTYGRVQVPFLIDPNHAVEMFESADILDYLEKTYAK